MRQIGLGAKSLDFEIIFILYLTNYPIILFVELNYDSFENISIRKKLLAITIII